jgi:DNA-binding transcriptional LysR family regulator
MTAIRWDDVPLFLALLRERNLSRAAKRLGLDASTASRRLVSLEECSGSRLFDRSRQGLAPTEAAEQMLPAAEEMERAAFKLASTADGLQSGVEGVVRISAIPGFVDAYLAPRLAELVARYPRLRLEVDARATVSDLTRREADIAIRSIRPRSGELVMTKLTTARWLAMASPRVARELGTLRRWDDARWITWDDDLAHIPAARWVAEHVATPPVLRTSSIGAQVAAVEHGLGVALFDEYAPGVHEVAPVAYARGLAESAARWPVDDLWLVGHAALRDTPRVAAVWEFIVEMVRTFTPKAADKRRQRLPSGA